jgi:hypothetical protein
MKDFHLSTLQGKGYLTSFRIVIGTSFQFQSERALLAIILNPISNIRYNIFEFLLVVSVAKRGLVLVIFKAVSTVVREQDRSRFPSEHEPC